MDSIQTHPLRIGAWRVEPAAGQISQGDEVVRLEMRTMRLLVCLAQRAGEVVSIDELLDQAWAGVIVTPDSVYQAVASLRRALGDDPKRPTYIATVPRLGYRMVARVAACDDTRQVPAPLPAPFVATGVDVPRRTGLRSHARALFAAGVALALMLSVLYLRGHPFGALSSQALPSVSRIAEEAIGVLPFLDLTEEMDEEPFADGMTEELINKLSKIPGVRVPSFTSSLNFKGKQRTIDDVAKTLGVAYVLEGSVRKSGSTLRVTAQLIRADKGYLVWSETYDRTMADMLVIQDEIAAEVKHALEASLKHPPAATGAATAP